MKRTLTIVSLLALGACSSAKKANQVAEVPKPAAVTVTKEAKVEKKISNGKEYTCQVLNDKRVVEFKTDAGRCEIHYTKFGNSEQVAWAEATPTICSDVFAKIRSNIEEKGFSCESGAKNLAAK